MDDPMLEVRRLRVWSRAVRADVVDGVSFHIAEGEILGIVGESGSGKTTVAHAVLGYCRRGLRFVDGEVRIARGENLLTLAVEELQRVRGGVVSYVPQDPAAALNPGLRIETQLMEVLETHAFGRSDTERRARLLEVLDEVRLPADQRFLRRFPHQLSGGQQQRVVIAMAFACRPRVIVMDEPTTGLDVTTQAHVLRTLRGLCAKQRVAAVFVSHDLAVVSQMAQRVAVMLGGRIVEMGLTSDVLASPEHRYTARLLEAMPDVSRPRRIVGAGSAASGSRLADERRRPQAPPTAPSATRTDRRSEMPAILRLEGVSATYGARRVVHDVSFQVEPGECLALVGQSGSGKTTLSRCIAGLHDAFEGTIRFRGHALPAGARSRTNDVRRSIQYIFQNPYGSLNPRRTVGQSVAQPIRLLLDAPRSEIDQRVAAVFDAVGLPATIQDRYPDELSGGQRQRVAIARALVLEPALLVCDEITSSIDVSAQSLIVELLRNLQERTGMTLLFVTHDLTLARSVAQHIVVLNEGRVVESGATDDVLEHPREEYTRTLLADTPSFTRPQPRSGMWGRPRLVDTGG